MLDALAKGAEVNVCTDGRHESPLMLAAGARSSRGPFRREGLMLPGGFWKEDVCCFFET